jgi:hypothetical protein
MYNDIYIYMYNDIYICIMILAKVSPKLGQGAGPKLREEWPFTDERIKDQPQITILQMRFSRYIIDNIDNHR